MLKNIIPFVHFNNDAHCSKLFHYKSEKIFYIHLQYFFQIARQVFWSQKTHYFPKCQKIWLIQYLESWTLALESNHTPLWEELLAAVVTGTLISQSEVHIHSYGWYPVPSSFLYFSSLSSHFDICQHFTQYSKQYQCHLLVVCHRVFLLELSRLGGSCGVTLTF